MPFLLIRNQRRNASMSKEIRTISVQIENKESELAGRRRNIERGTGRGFANKRLGKNRKRPMPQKKLRFPRGCFIFSPMAGLF